MTDNPKPTDPVAQLDRAPAPKPKVPESGRDRQLIEWYDRNIDRMMVGLRKAGRRVMARRAAEHAALMRRRADGK